MNPVKFLFIIFFPAPGSTDEKTISSAALTQSVDNLTIMTEIYPPYNFKEKGELKGISVDLMVLILKKLGSRQTRNNIKLWPWARGYREVLGKKNTCLFSTTRTIEREKHFKWVGPITSTTISILARKKKN